jgi:hypothetical protein
MKRLDTWLTIAIAAAAVVQSVFAGFLWWLQRELSQELRHAFVAVALEAHPNLTRRIAVRFENASSSGVLLRYLNLVASAKGRTSNAMKLDYRMSIPGHGSREVDITDEIYNAAHHVDEGDPAWTTGESITVSFELEPHYTTILRKKRKGPCVTYKLEFAGGVIKSCSIEEDED